MSMRAFVPLCVCVHMCEPFSLHTGQLLPWIKACIRCLAVVQAVAGMFVAVAPQVLQA